MKAKTKPRKCYNCKYASKGFKLTSGTHHHCHHSMHDKGLESGELSGWDTLRNFYDTCESHESRAVNDNQILNHERT